MSTPYQPPSAEDPGPREPYASHGRAEQDPYGRPGTGYPGQAAEPYRDGYGGGAYQQGYAAPTGDHPQGVLILVLGIAGLVVAGLLSPVAWGLGSRALKDIRATGQHPGNEQLIVVGRILGIIGTVLLALAVLLGVVVVVIFAAAAATIGLQ